jgi:2-methylaconitate cis-trans-isomerase PrpF
LSFCRLVRTGKLLPTGRATDRLDVADHGRIPASLVDAANPVCYVPAAAVGTTGTKKPREIGGHQRDQKHLLRA